MDAAGRGRGAGGELALRRALQKRRRSESAAQGFPRSQRPRSASGRRLHARSRLARRWRDADLSARSEEHTSELQSLMRISYAVFCLKKKTISYDKIQLINE